MRRTSRVAAIFGFMISGVFSGPSPVGINLTWLGEPTSNEWVFVDVMKLGSPWYTVSEDWSAWTYQDTTLPADENGYPTQLPDSIRLVTQIFNRQDGRFPAGEYLFLFEGSGVVYPDWDAVVTDSSTPGRWLVQVTPSDEGIAVVLEETDPNDPIRNVRLIMPGFHDNYEEQIFHPLFLERWQPFQVIRYMMWQKTQASPNQHWENRVTPSHYVQGTHYGAALEHCIQLSNRLHADAWFSIPHRATDDYVRQFAQMVRDSLNPDLKAYFEYSNEIWNPDPEYQQHTYAMDSALALGLTADSGYASFYYNAHRSLQIWDILEEVFSDTSRYVKVIATQAGGYHDWTRQMLSYQNTGARADLLAFGSYFMPEFDRFFDGSSFPDSVASLSLDEAFDFVWSIMDQSNIYAKEVRDVAAEFNLPLAAYEGGQSLNPFGEDLDVNTPFSAKMLEVNRDPRMKEIYREMFADWDSLGGGLFMHFNSTEVPAPWGWFGTLEYMEQDTATAYKYQALVEYMGEDANVPVSPGSGKLRIRGPQNIKHYTVDGRRVRSVPAERGKPYRVILPVKVRND